MNDIELENGKRIFELSLGKFNNDTKLFEATEDSWWRGTLSYNDIKYNIFDNTTLREYYKQLELNYLYEGLITSATPNKVVNILTNNALGFINDIRIVIMPLATDDIKIPIIDFFIYKDDFYNIEYGEFAFKELTKLIDLLGYFISSKKENGNKINVVIMPKFIYDVTTQVYDSQNNDGILFHITPYVNISKIEKNGLIPRHKSYRFDNYPDRIYFYLKKQEKSLDILCKNLSSETDIKRWLVLKIDLKDRRSYKEGDNSTTYKFFDDPKALHAVFTYENIDPLCISIYKEIRLD